MEDSIYNRLEEGRSRNILNGLLQHSGGVQVMAMLQRKGWTQTLFEERLSSLHKIRRGKRER